MGILLGHVTHGEVKEQTGHRIRHNHNRRIGIDANFKVLMAVRMSVDPWAETNVLAKHIACTLWTEDVQGVAPERTIVVDEITSQVIISYGKKWCKNCHKAQAETVHSAVMRTSVFYFWFKLAENSGDYKGK
jgi:hypothetical protein